MLLPYPENVLGGQLHCPFEIEILNLHEEQFEAETHASQFFGHFDGYLELL